MQPRLETMEVLRLESFMPPSHLPWSADVAIMRCPPSFVRHIGERCTLNSVCMFACKQITMQGAYPDGPDVQSG